MIVPRLLGSTAGSNPDIPKKSQMGDIDTRVARTFLTHYKVIFYTVIVLSTFLGPLLCMLLFTEAVHQCFSKYLNVLLRKVNKMFIKGEIMPILIRFLIKLHVLLINIKIFTWNILIKFCL